MSDQATAFHTNRDCAVAGIGQRKRRGDAVVVELAGDHRLVDVAVQKLDQHLAADAGQRVAAPAGAVQSATRTQVPLVSSPRACPSGWVRDAVSVRLPGLGVGPRCHGNYTRT